MTIEEVVRAIKSRNRVKKTEAQEKASFDYILANLIGKYVARALNGKETIPKLEEAYNGIFDDVAAEQQKQLEKQRANLSALRFKQFAEAHNKKMKNKGARN